MGNGNYYDNVGFRQWESDDTDTDNEDNDDAQKDKIRDEDANDSDDEDNNRNNEDDLNNDDDDDQDEGRDMRTMASMNSFLNSDDGQRSRTHSTQRRKRKRRRDDRDDDEDSDYDYRRRLADEYEAYYNEFYDQEADFEERINNELSGKMMRFKFDGDWDEIHRMDAMNKASKEYNEWTPYSAAKVYDGQAIQKCATLQTAQVCGTLMKANEPMFEINVKVGAHKHFKLTPSALKEEYSAILEDFADDLDYFEEAEEESDEFSAIVGEEGDYYLIYDGFYYDEDGNVEYEYYYDEQQQVADESAMDTFFDEQTELEWIVENEVTADYDADWANDNLWDEINEFTTFSAKKLKKKCMRVFGRKLCLCEFVEEIVSPKKHVCHPHKAEKEKKKMIQKIKNDLKKKEQRLKKRKKMKLKRIKKKEMERRKRLNKQKKKLIKKEKKKIKKKKKKKKGKKKKKKKKKS